MLSHPDHERPLRHWLSGGPSGLPGLLERAERLARATELIHTRLGAPWATAVRAANLRGATLVLFVDTAAVLVPLRRWQTRLLDLVEPALGSRPQKIQAKVRPATRQG